MNARTGGTAFRTTRTSIRAMKWNSSSPGSGRPGPSSGWIRWDFTSREWPGGFRASTGLSRLQGVLWRWPQPTRKGMGGAVLSREAAETVRHDHGPGYLVCGVCGWDAWKTELPAHYRRHHGPATDSVPSDQAAGRRPIRRIVA